MSNKLKKDLTDTINEAFKLEAIPEGQSRKDAEWSYRHLAEGLSTSIESYVEFVVEGIQAGESKAAEGSAAIIAKSSIANSKLADVPAFTIKGNNTAGTTAPLDLTPTQVRSLLSINNVENTTLSTWTGSTNLTTLGTVTTGVWTGTPISSEYVSTPKIGTVAGGTSLTRHFNESESAGAFGDGPFVTYVSPGVVAVAGGEGYIRSANTSESPLLLFAWSAPDNITLATPAIGQESSSWIGVEYNAGSPQVTARSSYNWNFRTDFPLARVNFDGTFTDILNSYSHAGDSPNLIRQFLRKAFPFIRESPPEGSGGLILGETGTRNLTMTGATIWHALSKFTIASIDTSLSGTFHLIYRLAAGGFLMSAGNTQWPNTLYDDGSGTLATMTNNKYACLWVYLDVADGELEIVYGRGQYTSSTLAQDEGAPTIPDHLINNGKLIGRIIFQKSAATATSIESTSEASFVPAPVTDHNQLSNLQGGILTEYYHLTAADYAVRLTGSTAFTTAGTITTGVWSATAVDATHGGTAQTSWTVGDILYSDNTNTLAKLAGNSTMTKKFLSMTGSGALASAPTWETTTKADVGLSVVENTALSTWAGSTNLTTLGTVTTGIWNGTAIDATHGGTNQTTWAVGDILYASATNTLAKLTAGANPRTPGLFLKTRSTTAAPYWGGPQGFGSIPTTMGSAQGPSSESADADTGVTVTWSGTSLSNCSRWASLATPRCYGGMYTETTTTGNPVGFGVYSATGLDTDPATILAREPGGQWQLWTDNGAPGVPARDGALINLPDYACVMVVVEASSGAKWYGSNSGEPGSWVLLASKTLTVPAYTLCAGISGTTMTVNRYFSGTGATAYQAQLIPYTTINANTAASTNVFPYYTAPYTIALGAITTAGRAILDDADATAQKNTLGLATVATSASAADLSAGTLLAVRMPALTGDVTSTVGTVATTVIAASTTTAGKIEIAVQTEMEAATDNTRAVSPAAVQWHPGVAKAWLFSIVTGGVPANTAGYNITSISDAGVGRLGITVATDFSSVNWSSVATTELTSTTYAVANDRKVYVRLGLKSVTYVELDCIDSTAVTNLAKDPNTWNFAGFGDQ